MDAIDVVRNLISEGLAPGSVREAGPLAVVGLFGGAPAKEYVLGQHAFAEGTLQIEELDGGSVPELRAINQGDLPVLLLDGEHLKGAKQDRIVNASILLPAGRETILPVSCVEQGRWHYEGGTTFTPAEDISYARLRRTSAESRSANAVFGSAHEVDQGAVWDEVAEKHREMGVSASSTGAMDDAYTLRRDDLEEIAVALAEPQPGQTGAIAVVAGTPVALDAFDRPETFSAIWPRLVRGYAMEALGAPSQKVDDATIERFLDGAVGVQLKESPAVGLGTDVTMTSRKIVGGALAWAEGVVHMAIFPRDDAAPTDFGGDIERPSHRRLRLY